MPLYPDLKRVKNPSIAIRNFLKSEGYEVSVVKSTTSISGYGYIFTVKTSDNQAFPIENFSSILQVYSRPNAQHTPHIIAMNADGWQEVFKVLAADKKQPPKTKKSPASTPSATTSVKNPDFSTENIHQNPIRRTPKQIIQARADALALLDRADFETMVLTEAERAVLEDFPGVGSDYDESKGFDHNEAALTQFYTPPFAADAIYAIAASLGVPANGRVLEPSCGVGRLLKPAANAANCVAFEVDKTAFRIAKKLYPAATIYNQYFETAFLAAPRYNTVAKNGSWLGEFDFVVGNPPYGKHKNEYQSFFPKRWSQIEFFFFYYGVKLLKPGGILAYVTGSNIIRNGFSYQGFKKELFSLCEFVTAYRMPNEFMEATQVGSDIIFLRKK